MAVGRRIVVVLVLVVVAAIASRAAAAAPPAWNEVEPAASCTFQEVNALGIPVRVQVFEGFYAIIEMQAALRRACRLVPAYWQRANRSFFLATRIVDRLWPGVGSWAHSCASSEGGHGAWVPNRKGSGAGGWMQFKSQTFWSVIDGALARARALGVRVPAFARSWYSPLGQAFAAAEMIFDGRRGEWAGSTC